MKEETLSEQRECLKELTLDECDYHKFVYYEEDVKEFIKKLKYEIEDAQENYAMFDWIDKDHAIYLINKLAGDKLTEEQEQSKE
jgi:hypothetical protein